MIRARLSRMATGHWLATFKDGDTVFRTQVVGKASDKAGDVLKFVASAFTVDQVGVKATDIGPNCALACGRQGYGNTLWMRPGFGK